MKIGNMFDSLKNNVDNYINRKVAEADQFQQIVESSKIFNLDNDIPKNEDNIVIANIYEYNELCAYLNLKKTKNIDYVIAVDETVITIMDIQEKKTYKKYLMVLTDRRIVIMNDEKYTDYTYETASKLKLITKGLMTQTIYFDNNVIDINLNYQDMVNVYHLITQPEARKQIVASKREYLCGVTPIYQKINKILSGITIGTNNEIVFHNRKKENYLCQHDDILNYELMEDNTVIREKPKKEKSQALGFSKQECYEMSLRVTLTNNTQFKITILEMDTFNNSFSHKNSIYTDTYSFAKEIMDKLDSLYDEEKKH